MLSQLEFKLSVEKQYKDGVEKMVRLYQDEGDRKSKADAEARRIESNQKIQLLRQSLKRYEDLHVDMESSNDAPDGKNPRPGPFAQQSMCLYPDSQTTPLIHLICESL